MEIILSSKIELMLLMAIVGLIVNVIYIMAFYFITQIFDVLKKFR